MSAIKIAICMGSQSDWPTMKEAAAILDSLMCHAISVSSLPIAPLTGWPNLPVPQSYRL